MAESQVPARGYPTAIVFSRRAGFSKNQKGPQGIRITHLQRLEDAVGVQMAFSTLQGIKSGTSRSASGLKWVYRGAILLYNMGQQKIPRTYF